MNDLQPPLPPLQQVSKLLNPKYYHPFTFQIEIASSGSSTSFQLDLGQASDLFIVSSQIDMYQSASSGAGARVLPTQSACDPVLISVLIGTNYNLVSGNSGITIWQYNDMWNNNFMQKGWIIGDRFITMTAQHQAITSTANFVFPLTLFVSLNGYKLTGEAR